MLLITGAAGFIGTNALAQLNKTGHTDIVCVDRLDTEDKCRRLAQHQFAYYYDYADIARALHEHDVTHVLHLGAQTNTRHENVTETMQQNYAFSCDLLERLPDRCVFVYASSAAVYGRCPQNPTTGNRELAFGLDERPGTAYGLSKLMFDNAVRRYIREHASDPRAAHCTGLRFFNVYGPGEAHKGPARSLIRQFLDAVIRHQHPQLFSGSEHIRRDFVYVDDVIDVCMSALFNDKQPGVYNVGTGVATAVTDLVEIAYAAIGDRRRAYTTLPPDTAPKHGYQTHTQADLTALRAAGYTTTFRDIRDGVTTYCLRALQ